MSNEKKHMVTRIIIFSVILIGIVGWTYASLIDNKEEVEGRVYRREFSKAVPVKVAKAMLSSLSQEQRYLGTFEANRQITLTSQTQGEVIKVLAKEGDALKKDALIAKIDEEQLRNQLIAAEAAFNDAEREVARYKNLTEKNAVAGVQYEKAQLQLASAESQLKVLKKNISYTNIRAPFSGIMVRRDFDLGSILSPGSPIGELADISTLKLVVKVPEENLFQFKEGMEVEVRTDVHPEARYEGKVAMIGSLGDDAHSFPVHIEVPNSNEYPLKAGMYGTTMLQDKLKEQKLSIPVSALVGSTKEPKVFVVKDDLAVLIDISIGKITASQMEVIDGLAEGDIVVVNGQINLSDGISVKY